MKLKNLRCIQPKKLRYKETQSHKKEQEKFIKLKKKRERQKRGKEWASRKRNKNYKKY